MAQVLARLLAATALSAALFAVAPGCAQPVRVDFDAQQDFGAYRIWAWLPPGRAAAAGSGAVTPELDAALRGAIERELAGRGYALAGDGEAPDFFVGYQLQLRTQLVLKNETPAARTLPTHHGGRGEVGAYEIQQTEQRLVAYEIGLLGVQVADASERQIVWRGIGRSRVRNRFLDRVDTAVAEIVERFPQRPVP